MGLLIMLDDDWERGFFIGMICGAVTVCLLIAVIMAS